MNTLDEWTATVARELGVEDVLDRPAATKAILDVSRDVAHGVARPAAPVTAYLVGLAAGRAADPRVALGELAAQVSALTERWQAEHGKPEA